MEDTLSIAFDKLALRSFEGDDGLLFSEYTLNFSIDEMCVIEGKTWKRTKIDFKTIVLQKTITYLRLTV